MLVYDDIAFMWAAAKAFNGNDVRGTLGVTQACTDHAGRACRVTVRLVRSHPPVRFGVAHCCVCSVVCHHIGSCADMQSALPRHAGQLKPMIEMDIPGTQLG